MKRIYAPWRTQYTQKKDVYRNNDVQDECIFCSQFATNMDEKFFIIKRYSHCALMLNTFPYNAGHLLVIPFEHTATLYALNQKTREECMEVISHATQVIGSVLNPEGFNIGINMGKAAGASIPTHVHIHVLPRWSGDTNFLPTLADTKQISVDLLQVFEQFKKVFNQ
ncbi:MAG TPA: HIT domain-containing protein [Candidatus Babeliales bacterium]|nr:HIT domain-containing protein [Candidatus Babeliales bacterium]